MRIHYLEIVTKEVDAICAMYAAAHGVQFGKPDVGLGNARTATSHATFDALVYVDTLRPAISATRAP